MSAVCQTLDLACFRVSSSFEDKKAPSARESHGGATIAEPCPPAMSEQSSAESPARHGPASSDCHRPPEMGPRPRAKAARRGPAGDGLDASDGPLRPSRVL